MNSDAAAAGANKATSQLKAKESRQFKSKAPKAGGKGFDAGLDGPGGPEVVCPWESFGDVELSDLAQFGIV